ncbi:MAG: rod shape-determining protein MreC [Oscillospiraceae bacterium]|nr:rod shape-determining protein MreC [Oscillospiraceae bacterium]
MKRFFTNRIRIVLVTAVLLAVVLAVVSSLTGMKLPQMVVQGVLTPLRSGVSKLSDRSQQLYDYIFRYESLLAENQALKEELAAIEDEARDAYATKQENERLRAALDLVNANEDYKLVDAYIISTSSADWSNTFTINRGSNVGITEGMCAITAYGELVGLVSEVGVNYAVVKSVLDSSLEISATIAASGHSGMVQGGYASGLDGLLRMNYLPSSATIRNHDQVVTTGSTVYPRNLVLGHVVDAGFDDTGVAKYALLQPAVDVRSLEQVFIVTEYNAG